MTTSEIGCGIRFVAPPNRMFSPAPLITGWRLPVPYWLCELKE